MTYSISCVLLIPAEHQSEINALAESLGYGPNNLSVALADSSGNKWYGCHTWCGQLLLDQLADPEYQSTTSALIISSVPGGDPAINWVQALADNGLTVVSDNEE